ncbi:hypothetical protein BS78_10G040600 [Paspalum vaginatum]|nr:hypothetical protein BS78_10G040600 [Paspalum vaginatum]KAJ1258007.1 hypothetical protein BS78_10G040600 [Paspalum vaginatum]KAJ1258008.1 hypothetical protein BS78_10G040600 [Paspalum vaginatum]
MVIWLGFPLYLKNLFVIGSFSVHLMIAPTLPAHLHLKTHFMGRSANTGLYVVHYARAFDGQRVDFDLKEQSESNLAEPRAEILYSLLTMVVNAGYQPEDLLEKLGFQV